jgi:alpha-galactosidase
MLAIGWGGTWKANFEFDGKNTLYTAQSVINLATYLKPNEKIRTALFVVGDYALRDDAYATNYWRSWYMEHNIPKADSEGNAIAPFSTCCIAGDTGLPNSDGSISERYFTWKPSLEKMISEDVKSDFRWVDAGWYIAPDLHSEETNWWGTVGTWTLDPVKWPEKTFLESTDFARANGMKTLMWFEPERVSDVDNLVKNFGYNEKWGIKMEGTKAISNNIGDPECFEWTVGQICKVLRDNKVEMYREDNNCKAAELWAYMDTVEGTDRLGITESKLIDAHYRMWDKLIECTLSYGGCGFVDSCASGGGRNDLESMRRGIPLLRSDADRTTISLRLSMTSSFNKWIPFCGASTKETRLQLETAGLNDTYIWRTSYLAALNLYSRFVYAEEGEFEALRKGISEWKEINKYLLKEFYTLTPWHHRDDRAGFTAFMYFDPDEEKGILFAVRQEECEEDTVELTLPILEACTVTDKDTNLALDIKNRKISVKFENSRCAKAFWVEVK